MKTATPIDWAIYCNGNKESGLGHLARCLGFAEALLSCGQQPSFIGSYHSLAESMIRSVGLPIFNIGQNKSKSLETIFKETDLNPQKGILLDDYALTTKELRATRELYPLSSIILIDDFADREEYICDAVINFTVGAEDRVYPEHVKTYLGLKYYPARNWLRTVRNQRAFERNDASKQSEKWLIICGGTDYYDVTLRLLETLAKCVPSAEVKLLRAHGISEERLQKSIRQFDQYEILTPKPELQDLFLWTDVCLCGGGLTKYECAFSGIPVASFAQTEGQQADTKILSQKGLIFDLGPAYQDPEALPINTFDSFLNDHNHLASCIAIGQTIVGAEEASITASPFLS